MKNVIYSVFKWITENEFLSLKKKKLVRHVITLIFVINAKNLT